MGGAGRVLSPNGGGDAQRLRALGECGAGGPVHHDTSHHRWLPGVDGYQNLILTQDDYSRQIVGWRLEGQERLWDHLCVVRDTIARWGGR